MRAITGGVLCTVAGAASLPFTAYRSLACEPKASLVVLIPKETGYGKDDLHV